MPNNLDSTSAMIGGLSARMDQMEMQIASMKSDVATMLNILNQAKGGWRVILGFCAFVGGVLGLFELLKRAIG